MLGIIFAFRAPALAQDASPPTTAALAIDEPVRLDGNLDEPFWSRIAPATGFEQRQPDPGAPASERTEIRIAFDERNLYIGILALDSDPGAVVAKSLQRDGQGSFGGFGGNSGAYRDDDSVGIVLDTFLDRRNGFYFETNANGARADALIENEGDSNFQWDGVWNAAGRRTAEGWSAELVIPFSTLRFDPEIDTWGLNARRLIRRKNEEVLWAPVGLDADLLRMSLAGSVTGIQGVQPGLNLRIKPFATGSSGRDYLEPEQSPGEDGDLGLDLLRWGITDSMTLDLTVNTDFAQVEADAQQINLTRFSLFFPEKREFFLENAGIFEYANTGGGGGFRPPLLRLFHSRRIGLDEDGEIIPINVGGRFTGRAGGWNWGLLSVQTRAVEEVGVNRTNWTVARVKRNVGDRSAFGAIFTNKQVSGHDYNRVIGFDADINPTRRLNFNGFFTASRDRDPTQGAVTDWAAGAGFGWRGGLWRARATVHEVRADFRPEMGFLLREGIRRYNWDVDFEPRPANNLGIRNLTFNSRAEIITRSDGTLETVDSSLRFFGFDLRSGDRVSLFAGYNYEQLFEEFEISDGVVIPVGQYTFFDIGVFFRTDGSRPIALDGFWTWGQFYDGHRLNGRTGLTLRLSRLFSANTSWSFNDVDLPAGAFTTNLVQQRFDLAFSPNLFWNTFVQYNDADDLITLNSRLNWIYRPGADIFLVYNHDWETGAGGRPAERAIILKFTYLFML